MDVDGLMDVLEYRGAAGFLDPSRAGEAIEHAHGLRHLDVVCSGKDGVGRFRGAYMLRAKSGGTHASTPTVLLFEAPNAREANRIHKIAWNQGMAPFVLVHTPEGVRLYSGFDFEVDDGDSTTPLQRGVLAACVAFDEVAKRLAAFRATAIESGEVWDDWGHRVDPARRVDERLLAELKKLGDWLERRAALDRPTAHALIGRMVYLRYLRERGVLTDARLAAWDLDSSVFSRRVQRRSFASLVTRVDDWLNGTIFPLRGTPKTEVLQAVAGVILGDEVDGQLHLDFRAYDFSHIPVELLSAIYEQFIASEGRDAEAGAYYTPIPLVNFVLSELDALRPLQRGMRVLDPSCGSGAFLVQCYQLLVERERQRLGRALQPRELRELLIEHIVGVDREEGACRVAEFSLCLALLDQIPVETLLRAHNFKLPSLHGTSIFHGDFFDGGPWASKRFDWVVGNPPWLKANDARSSARRWMATHAKESPVCKYQVAEAFAWKAGELLSESTGMAALVMPAMTTLFSSDPEFRRAFFSRMGVSVVANLSNLRRDLFHGCEQPAAVLFFEGRRTLRMDDVAVFSPFVLNQRANRSNVEGKRQVVWTINVNHGEVKFLPVTEIADGDALPWKIAMWGSHRDGLLLRRVERRFESLAQFSRGRWALSAGLELRARGTSDVDPVPQVAGERRLLSDALKGLDHVHSFADHMMHVVDETNAYVRAGRGETALAGCRPPMVFVSGARRHAVFCEHFLVVPPRQIGISGAVSDADLLRVLALYLNSDFAQYHQFMRSPQSGVREGRSTLAVLRGLPVPFEGLAPSSIERLVGIHRALVALSDERWAWRDRSSDARLSDWPRLHEFAPLEREMNELFFDALGLAREERWLISDLVHVRMSLVDGKVGDAALRRPDEADLRAYGEALRDVLDDWLDRGKRFRHQVGIVRERDAGMVRMRFTTNQTRASQSIAIEPALGRVAGAMREVRAQIERSQPGWLYFDRNLLMHIDEELYLCKPMERVAWTRSQALADADRIIAEFVAAGAAA
jgi:hypothetical protein